jgi:hypothetical protein
MTANADVFVIRTDNLEFYQRECMNRVLGNLNEDITITPTGSTIEVQVSSGRALLLNSGEGSRNYLAVRLGRKCPSVNWVERIRVK